MEVTRINNWFEKFGRFEVKHRWAFLICLIPHNKTIIPAMLMKPFALLCSAEGRFPGNIDIEGEAQMMLAAARLLYGTKCCLPGPGPAPAAVFVQIISDFTVQR